MSISIVEPHKNVMLLSMSTLPWVPKMNTYQVEEDGRTLYFKSLSQMEPHTKYVICKLASLRERLARIVILESEKARTEKPENWGGETATSMYRKRLANYLGRNEDIPITVNDVLSDIPETSVVDMKPANIEDAYRLPEIIQIDLEDPVFFWHAVNAIRGRSTDVDCAEDAEKKIHLYMDMQGGDRNSVAQMNAIVELLERQGVDVCGRYANDFEPKRPKPLHTIRETSREYRTYDLISAMDAFSRYGWGDNLEAYFRGKVRGNSKEKKLIKAIQQASSAISKCNANGFDGAIQKIKNLKEDFENPEIITELDVVYQDIQEDYASLLNAKYPHVAQIRWCLDKKFLQQALTIFEAKMPQEFVLSGLVYYLKKDASNNQKTAFLKTCERIYLDKYSFVENGALRYKAGRYSMKDLNHYLIKEYCNGYNKSEQKYYIRDPKHILQYGLGSNRKGKVLPLLIQYRELCSLRNQMNHAMVGGHHSGGYFEYMKMKYPNDNNWEDSVEADYENQLRNYLDQWEKLADQVPEDLRASILDLS